MPALADPAVGLGGGGRLGEGIQARESPKLKTPRSQIIENMTEV